MPGAPSWGGSPDGGNGGGSQRGPQPADPPAITLPKGGAAIRGIGEKFAANPVTGTGSVSVPLPLSPGRSGFGPQLSLSYDSGAGNGPFGFGWTLSLPEITRRTDKGVPRYEDDAESDVFVLSGAEDLVPVLDGVHGWRRVSLSDPDYAPGFAVDRYRPRVEGLFARIERWTRRVDGDVHWRSITRDNVTTLYGANERSRIQDLPPGSGGDAPACVFSWLICQSFDDRGNVVVYDYTPEDDTGVDLGQAHEGNRPAVARVRNRYLSSIRYGNRVSRLVAETVSDRGWMFEVVFDYGGHDPVNPAPGDMGQWLCRRDPFSSYRAGFEVRTYRLCQRVLMFHHFPAVAGVGRDCLVRSLDIAYRHNPGDVNGQRLGHPVASTIASLTQRGYARSSSGYSIKAMPALEFGYTDAEILEELHTLDPASLENLPAGLNGAGYRWLDLDGDAVMGVLSEQAGAWLYKRGTGGGRFGPLEPVARTPSMAGVMTGAPYFLDLAGDGLLDVVEVAGPAPGFAERTPERSWEPFTPFSSLPNLAWDDPNLRFIDLTGDGMADVLVTEDDGLVWCASLGEDGFGPARRVPHHGSEEEAPRVVFADGEDDVYLADMSGDGLADLVRIRNREVCYWPNLGYGQFGAKVTMDAAPWFDRCDGFDQRRIRLADIDGSGTTDLIYLGAGGARVWANQAGNRWGPPWLLTQAPVAEDVTGVAALDLLGTGTACLVWSSPLPGDAGRQVRYLDLMGGQKPHLLVSICNNLGARTAVSYAPSTRFFLADREAGRPWATRLPFPVHVVERVEVIDEVAGDRFTSRYAYHHGHYDGAEREFRGFGMVEQWDTEEYAALAAGPPAANVVAASHTPPVVTRTWFHTGAYEEGAAISRALAHEYHGAPDRDDGPGWATFEAGLLPDTVLPDALPPIGGSPGAPLTADEQREACRALKGALLRQEVYAEDGGARAGLPYTVTERNYTIVPLQPRGDNRHAVFFTHPREAITELHERTCYPVAGELVADPRVTHAVTLAVDDFGNVLASAAIGYGRRHDSPDSVFTDTDRAVQGRTLATYTVNRFTDPVPTGGHHRGPAPCESRTWQLTAAGLGESARVSIHDLRALLDAATYLGYEQNTGDATPQLRLIEHTRTRYRADDLSRLLPLGQLESLALPGHTERLVFTPALLVQRYGPRVTDAVLEAAGYLHSDGDANWWIPSGRSFYSPDPTDPAAVELAEARKHFFLPMRVTDPFGNPATVGYDADDLLPVTVADRVGNTIRAVNDYRVLQPVEVTDPNRNRSAVAFDELGMITATAVMGKAGEADPDRMGDTLADPTTRLEYSLFEWADHGRPVFVRTLARERHRDPGTRWQETLLYCDGLGREIGRKAIAEPGPLTEGGQPVSPRWVGTGWVIYNNKAQPIRQYEPFFAATSAFEARRQGVAATLCYDPVGRVVATLHPDHSWQKVTFDPWRQQAWDANDTVLIADPAADEDIGDLFARMPAADYLPTWYAQRAGGGLGDQAWAAAQQAAGHAQTPTLAFFDPLGRAFLTIADNAADGHYVTRLTLDIEGNTQAVTDARGLTTSYEHDMLGNPVRSDSPDAGQRASLANVLGRPAYSWDVRGFAKRIVYDAEQRPVERHIHDGTASRLAERTVYGEAQGEAANHRGRIYQVFDGAGILTATGYDFKGNPISSTRQLLKNYRDPVDWSTDPPLETEVFDASTTHDALNRPEAATTHDGSITRYAYNEAGLLEAVAVNLRGASTATPFLADVDYNAKGQRERAVLQITDTSGAPSTLTTTYDYDPLTFRLTHLTTTRATDGIRLQDLRYTYDPVGNITAIRDEAQPTIFYDGSIVTASSDYIYDAVYRLVEASGREHDSTGTLDAPDRFPQWKPHYDFNDSTRRGKTHPNDKNALRRYTQSYTYDSVGNILTMDHRVAGSGWTRSYEYATDSNRLQGTGLPGDPDGTYSARYTSDAHGNMLTMPHLPATQWDADDRLQLTQQQDVNAGIGQRTWYVYDATGQRVRKITEREGGSVKDERIYLGNLEYYRAHDGVGTVMLERETLHVMDGDHRIALIDTKTRAGGAALAVPETLTRYQLGNHLGSVTHELDEHGEVITYEEYHPYGTTAYQAGRSTTEVSLKRYRYAAKERDEETGLAYHSARYYAPWLARWTCCDPRGLADGTNPLSYCRNNPVSLCDPTGTASDVALDPKIHSARLLTNVAPRRTPGQHASRPPFAGQPPPGYQDARQDLEQQMGFYGTFIDRAAASSLAGARENWNSAIHSVAFTPGQRVGMLSKSLFYELGYLGSGIGYLAEHAAGSALELSLKNPGTIYSIAALDFIEERTHLMRELSDLSMAVPQLMIMDELAILGTRLTTLRLAALAAPAGQGGWESRLPGIQVRRFGCFWVKRVDPGANRLMQAWGRLSIRSQYEALNKLGDMAAPFKLHSGMLFTQDVGPTFPGGFRLLNQTSLEAYLEGSRRLGTYFNDIQPRNMGLNGLIFDPALDPVQKGIYIGGPPAAILGAVGGGYLLSKDR